MFTGAGFRPCCIPSAGCLVPAAFSLHVLNTPWPPWLVMVCSGERFSRCGVCCVAIPLAGEASTRFRVLTPCPSPPSFPDLLWRLADSLSLMRVSLKKGAHAGAVQSWVREIRDSAQMIPAIYHK